MQLGSLILPDDLIWTDEFDWSPVGQQITVTSGGSLVVEETAMQAGRPITLEGGPDRGWMDRATLSQLQTLAAAPAASYTLTLNDGRQFNVAFRRQQVSSLPGGGAPIKAQPVVDYSHVDDSDRYIVSLYLITV